MLPSREGVPSNKQITMPFYEWDNCIWEKYVCCLVIWIIINNTVHGFSFWLFNNRPEKVNWYHISSHSEDLQYHWPLMNWAEWGACLLLITQWPWESSMRGRRQGPQCELPGWQKCRPAWAQSKLLGHRWDPVKKDMTLNYFSRYSEVNVLQFSFVYA